MSKVLICVLSVFAIGVGLLQLRQQRLNLSYQNTRMHNQIEARQSTLWNQQLRIAAATSPNAIQQTVGDRQLDMEFVAPLPAEKASWIDARLDDVPAAGR